MAVAAGCVAPREVVRSFYPSCASRDVDATLEVGDGRISRITGFHDTAALARAVVEPPANGWIVERARVRRGPRVAASPR